MSGERLARASLALDAVYCAVMGLLVIVLRGRIGGLVQLPGIVIGAAGAALIGWAYVVLGQTVRIDWRKGIKQMMVVNTVATVLLALAAALHPVRGARALLAFIALDIVALGVAQALSLIRGRRKS